MKDAAFYIANVKTTKEQEEEKKTKHKIQHLCHPVFIHSLAQTN